MSNYLYVFLISMIPVVELRGAIPIGLALDLDPLACYILCVVGNMIPVPFIILFIRKVFAWMKEKSQWMARIADKLERKGMDKADRVLKYEKLGLYLFVAIPLPGTGAWTGSLIAALLDIRLKSALPMVFLGVCTAGAIMTLLTLGIISL